MALQLVPEVVLLYADDLAAAEPFIASLCAPIEAMLAENPDRAEAFAANGWTVRALVLGGATARGMIPEVAARADAGSGTP